MFWRTTGCAMSGHGDAVGAAAAALQPPGTIPHAHIAKKRSNEKRWNEMSASRNQTAVCAVVSFRESSSQSSCFG